jgi:hypothetical protein
MDAMSKKLIALVAASLLLFMGACNDNGDEGEAGTTTTTEAARPGDLLAEAKTVAVGFFEAQAVNDYDRARDESTGAAAQSIDWAEFVNGIDAVAGTPYAVPREEAPNLRVELDALDEGADGTYLATGFLEIGARPGGLETTTTTAAPETEGDTVEMATTFLVDLRFVRDGDDRLLVTDYRLDDVAYPASELYTDFGDEVQGTTTTTTTGAAEEADADVELVLELGHREVTGPVQYALSYRGDHRLDSASFFEDTTTTDTTPPPGASGEAVDIYVEDDADGGRALLVRAGAFPGGAGVMRLTFTGEGDEEIVIDLRVPEFPELNERPVNEVRDRVTATTTTTTSTTTTTTTVEPVTPPTEPPVTPTTQATTTTTAPATTTTTAPSG